MTPQEIRMMREELAWTQEEMGAYLNVSSVAVWKWETGRSVPDDYRTATLQQLRLRLDEAKRAREQQQFIQGLKVAGAIGAFAMLAYLFSKE